MHWTRTDAVRRWIVVVGLIAGPLILVLSVAVNLGAGGGSMRDAFDAIGADPGPILAQSLLETLGFALVLAALAGSTQALRSRGGVLGTVGAVLSILGIVGFALSNAAGFVLAELAQLPDHDAAFDTAGLVMSGDTAGTVGTIGMILEILGQVGILLVVLGLVRARLIRIWAVLLIIVGVVVNFAGGTMLTTLIADVLLLALGCWIAIALARCSREAWLGE